MEKYKEYKNSGIEWIGEIPEHWKVKPLKYIADITLGKMLTPEDKGDYILKPYLRSQNIQINDVDVSDMKNMWFSDKELKKYRLKKGDILVNEGGDIGRTCIWNNELDECYIQNSVNRVGMIDANEKYFLYHFYMHHFTGYFDSIVNRVSIPHLTKEKLENVVFVFPAFSEQTQIAQYLDHKTAQLDKLISDKEKLIELLNEERIAIINQAVTKGLNPDPEESGQVVAMKDSGIEWLGEVPEHWEVKKMKYVSNLKSGDTITSEVIIPEGAYPVYGGNGLRGYYEKFNLDGDYILIGRQGALCGNINYASNKFWASEHAIVCYLMNECHWRWFGSLLTYMDLNQYSQSAAQPGLSVEKIKNLLIPVPPYNEQLQISNYISSEEARICKIMNFSKQEIELLKEYKTALISEVVTGKVDVRA